MKKQNFLSAVLTILVLVLPLWAAVVVKFTKPPQGAEFSEGDWIDIKIKAISQLPLFNDSDDNSYYFDYVHGNPFYGHCRNRPQNHLGVDITFGPTGTFPTTRPIFPAYCGKIIDKRYMNGYGNTVTVYYPEIDKSVFYAHLASNFQSQIGRWVTPCDAFPFAVGGASGRTPPITDYHAHIEVFDHENIWQANSPFIENPIYTLFSNNLDSLVFSLIDEDGLLIDHIPWYVGSHDFFPYPDDCWDKSDSLEFELSYNTLDGDCDGKQNFVTATACGKSHSTSNPLNCCDGWKDVYYHSAPPPDEEAFIEGSGQTDFKVKEEPIPLEFIPSVCDIPGGSFRTTSDYTDLDGIIGPVQDTLVFAFNQQIDTLQAMHSVSLFNHLGSEIPTQQTFTPSESIMIVRPDTALFDCSNVHPYNIQFNENSLVAKSCPINKVEDDCDYDFLRQCTPHLYIFPLTSHVDVRVCDIYNPPLSWCEKTLYAIQNLGFGGADSFNWAYHGIRYRWPEPYKTYRVTGIFVGTPGYNISSWYSMFCSNHCDEIVFNYDYDQNSGFGTWELSLTDRVVTDAGTWRIIATMPEAGITVTSRLPIMLVKSVGLNRTLLPRRPIMYDLQCRIPGKPEIVCVSGSSQKTAQDRIFKEIQIWGLPMAYTWDLNATAGFYQFEETAAINCGSITGFGANPFISGTISARVCDGYECTYCNQCPAAMGITCGLGLWFGDAVCGNCAHAPYIDVNQVNTQDPTAGDYSPSTITLTPIVDDSVRTFVEAIYGSVPQLLVTENIIGYTLYPYYKPVASQDTLKYENQLPEEMSIICYPNPTNSSVDIELFLPETQTTQVFVLDELGRKVWEAPSQEYPAGANIVHWNISDDIPSGAYFAVLQSEQQRVTSKITIIK